MRNRKIKLVEIKVSDIEEGCRAVVSMSGTDLPHPYGTFNVSVPVELIRGHFRYNFEEAVTASGESYRETLTEAQREGLTGILMSSYVEALLDSCFRGGRREATGAINPLKYAEGKPASLGACLDKPYHPRWRKRGGLRT